MFRPASTGLDYFGGGLWLDSENVQCFDLLLQVLITLVVGCGLTQRMCNVSTCFYRS